MSKSLKLGVASLAFVAFNASAQCPNGCPNDPAPLPGDGTKVQVEVKPQTVVNPQTTVAPKVDVNAAADLKLQGTLKQDGTLKQEGTLKQDGTQLLKQDGKFTQEGSQVGTGGNADVDASNRSKTFVIGAVATTYVPATDAGGDLIIKNGITTMKCPVEAASTAANVFLVSASRSTSGVSDACKAGIDSFNKFMDPINKKNALVNDGQPGAGVAAFLEDKDMKGRVIQGFSAQREIAREKGDVNNQANLMAAMICQTPTTVKVNGKDVVSDKPAFCDDMQYAAPPAPPKPKVEYVPVPVPVLVPAPAPAASAPAPVATAPAPVAPAPKAATPKRALNAQAAKPAAPAASQPQSCTAKLAEARTKLAACGAK